VACSISLGLAKLCPESRITPEEAPPALLQIQPARPGRDEDVMDARMPFQPGARLQAVMTAQIIRDEKEVTGRIVGLNVCQKRDVAAFHCVRQPSRVSSLPSRTRNAP
jgi:hypothetical protein